MTVVAMKIAVINTSSSVEKSRIHRGPVRRGSVSRGGISGDAVVPSRCAPALSMLPFTLCFFRPRPVGQIVLAHYALSIETLELADDKMSVGDTLKMIHENHVDGRAADRAEQRHRAGSGPLSDDDTEAAGDGAHQVGDHRRRQIGNAALDKDRGGVSGEAADQRP